MPKSNKDHPWFFHIKPQRIFWNVAKQLYCYFYKAGTAGATDSGTHTQICRVQAQKQTTTKKIIEQTFKLKWTEHLSPWSKPRLLLIVEDVELAWEQLSGDNLSQHGLPMPFLQVENNMGFFSRERQTEKLRSCYIILFVTKYFNFYKVGDSPQCLYFIWRLDLKHSLHLYQWADNRCYCDTNGKQQ